MTCSVKIQSQGIIGENAANVVSCRDFSLVVTFVLTSVQNITTVVYQPSVHLHSNYTEVGGRVEGLNILIEEPLTKT